MMLRLTTLLSLLSLSVFITSSVLAAGIDGVSDHQTATQPTSQPASLDPAVEKILDRLEQRGKTIKTIEADIRYIKKDTVLDDVQKYTGILRFMEEKPNPRVFIRFDKFIQEGIVLKKKEWHVFDGQWYIEAREKTKTIVKHQIVRPGEVLSAFKLGQGPFPLPFGQKKAEILKHFSVKLVAPKSGDPKNADHLECTPLPGTEMAKKYATVHFYIDHKLDLPVRVQTLQKDEEVEISVTFLKIRLNTGMAASRLNLPRLSEYQVTTDLLPPKTAPPATTNK